MMTPDPEQPLSAPPQMMLQQGERKRGRARYRKRQRQSRTETTVKVLHFRFFTEPCYHTKSSNRRDRNLWKYNT
uniref:MIP06396p n=1 Tax=Drosophila melanogaster TaxID=7227 RepID=C0PPK6_DROME